MASQALHSILMESGTNELEILVFVIGKQRYGVNVAKVREVIEPLPLTRLPQSHPAVAGMFRLRDAVIPLVDLRRCFKLSDPPPTNSKIIVMEFNDVRLGFSVDQVHYIHRANVKDVEASPDMEGLREAPVTFIVRIEGELVLMVDFERIVFDIAGVDVFAENAMGVDVKVSRGDHRIMLVEDSHTIRKMIQNCLLSAGYVNVVPCADGQEALDALEKDLASNSELSFDLIITDIEMPKIDGFRLTKLIKDNPRMKNTPVVIFSSLVSQDNEKKCKAVGADAQITKPQLGLLVNLVDGLVIRKKAVACAV